MEQLEARVGGTFWFWLDNRYAFISAGGEKDKATGIPIPHIAIKDTDKGDVYYYKPGRLICYWDNRLTYETVEIEESNRKRFSGPPGREVEVPMFNPDDQGKQVKYLVDDFNCQNIRPDELRMRVGNGGYARSIKPLRPGHGSIALEMNDSVPGWQAYIRQGGFWHKPSGERIALNLSHEFEIGTQINPNYWAPFLGRYVFNGGVTYSESSSGPQNPGAMRSYEARYAVNVTTFSPIDGSIVKIKKPTGLLSTVMPQGVFATRAGLLWTGAIRTPGLYLSQGEKMQKILDEYVDPKEIHIAPNGCKVKLMSYPDYRLSPGRMSGPAGAIIDFSQSPNTTRRNHLLIDFCRAQ
ncbi:MAG: hypothetical protein HXY26_02485 [Hydrogenophilaceae bacterium]|nr:hypothetical protein [Hydrogenophilaceae bacterium]